MFLPMSERVAVARADRGLAKADTSGERGLPGVSRDDLSQSLCAGSRRAEEGAVQHLRSRRSIRRSRHATQKADQRGRIPNAVSISERPASVEDRAVPGHWEGDLLCGSKNSFIVTLVERHSRYVVLAKVPNRTPKPWSIH